MWFTNPFLYKPKSVFAGPIKYVKIIGEYKLNIIQPFLQVIQMNYY